MKQYPLPSPKSLEAIFANSNPARLAFELTRHCHEKRRDNQPLGNAEQTFCWLSDMGSRIVSDGFDSIFKQYFSPQSFLRVCDALKEAGALSLRKLLLEAWSIYTKSKDEISVDDLQAIDVRHFNTQQEMDRFDQIGEKVIAELEGQYERGKVWSVEYAKRHRCEFTSIE
jgi:hypothetical protein